MSGRLTRLTVGALDKAARLVRRSLEQPPHLATGRRGEEEAYFYLRKLGYVIVARNYRSHRRRSEIDLVGWDGDTLCFIEVKTRTTREIKPAEAAVDIHKQRDLRAIAREYLQRVRGHGPNKANFAPTGGPEHPPSRFDVLSIYLIDGGNPQFTLFKNAFRLS